MPTHNTEGRDGPGGTDGIHLPHHIRSKGTDRHGPGGPEDNPGYLPGLNSGAFNLGAGLSYAVLYAAQNAFTASGGATSGYIAAMVGGVILLGLAFCASLLIPKPGEQK